jgi:hypothetical protein
MSTLRIISETLEVPLPVLMFLSLSEEDIAEHKRDGFRVLSPAVNSFISEFFIDVPGPTKPI